MFVPCAGCSRHVRSEEATCPFCDRALAGPSRRAPRGASAVVVAGTLVLGALGCPRQQAAVYGGPPPRDPADFPPEPVPPSVEVDPEPPTAPPVPTATSTATAPGAEGPPEGRAGTLYGAPPPDTNFE